MVELKQSGTIGKLKDDNIYVQDIMGDNLQDKPLINVMDNEKK